MYRVVVYVEGKYNEYEIDESSYEDAVVRVMKEIEKGTLIKIEKKSFLDKKKEISKLIYKRKVSNKDLSVFTKKLYVLLKAGLPLIDSLERSKKKISDKRFRNIIEEVIKKVEQGQSLSDGFKEYGDLVPPVFYMTLEVSEESGTLVESLRQLAEYFDREIEFGARIKKAVTYPIVVVVLAILVSIGLFMYVVPNFVEILMDMDVELPLSTQIMIFVAENLVTILIMILMGLIGLMQGGRILLRKEGIRRKMERKINKIPYLGKLSVYIVLSRVYRSIALMLGAGVGLPKVLRISSELTKLLSFGDDVKKAENMVNMGYSLADAFENSSWVPEESLEMISIGEVSGSLDKMFEYMADTMDAEVEEIMGKLPSVIETLMIVVVGMGLFLMLISIFQPIFALYRGI